MEVLPPAETTADSPLPPPFQQNSTAPAKHRHKQRTPITHCLNCGAPVAGRYCQECGQETHDQSVALGTVLSEAVSELLSFDSKVVRTVWPLLVRPGFLTNEFNRGRRVRYLSPLKMYLVISALFFFVLSQQSVIKRSHLITFDPGKTTAVARTTALTQAQQEISASLAQAKTPQQRARLQAAKASLSAAIPPVASPGPHTSAPHGIRLVLGPHDLDADTLPKTVAAYDTQQAALPPSHRDTGAKRFLLRRLVKTRQSPQTLMQGFLDDLPRMMFVLLPAFALLLKLSYWRTKRLYVAHLIFALHTHAFVFLLVSGALLLPAALHWPALKIVSVLTLIYLVAACKVVYQQTWGRTFLAFGWLSFNYLFLLTFAFLLTLGAAFVLA